MADKTKDKLEEEVKEVVREVKSKMMGKIVSKTPFALNIVYVVNGVQYGARVEYDALRHSKLGVGDEIQIP
jgi:hypothetical protein